LDYNQCHLQGKTASERMKRTEITATLLIFISFSNVASERNYHGDVELGAVVTTGNTETVSAKTAINVEQDFETWRTEYVVDAQYQRSQFEDDEGEKQRETTQQQVFLSYQGNYKLEKEDRSFFILGSWNDERFNGYNHQITAATGYGWRFLKTDESTVDIEIGPGYSWNELDDGQKRQGTIFHGSFKFEHQLTVATRFRQEIVTDASFSGENSKTKFDASFIADINGRLAMKVSFFVEYNTKPDDDIKNIDTETGITLVYSF
jgi:putative salt-induced outer membrane protein